MIVDIDEDPFKDYDPNVGNLTSYTNSEEDEAKKKKKKEDEENKRKEERNR